VQAESLVHLNGMKGLLLRVCSTHQAGLFLCLQQKGVGRGRLNALCSEMWGSGRLRRGSQWQGLNGLRPSWPLFARPPPGGPLNTRRRS
jgi:hypothetical protein